MSKKRALPRLDAQVVRSTRYPDINEFLKDTQYAEQSSNYLDNQALARLTLVLARGDSIQLSTVNVAGFSRAFYLTSPTFYGYNPDIEVLGKVVISLPTFSGAPGFSATATRTNVDYSLQVTSADEVSGNNVLVNYKIVLSTRAVARILSYVFYNSAVEAFDYFSVGETEDAVYSAERLVSFVTSNLYALSIPLTLSYYYFSSQEPAFSLVTALSFKDMLSFLRQDFAPNSVSLTLAPFSSYFQLNVTAQRPVLLNVKITVAGKFFQQEIPVYTKGTQQIALTAGYFEFFTLLASQLTINNIPQVSATYTYKPIGYTLELVNPVSMPVRVDASTPTSLTAISWFFGNLVNEPKDGGSNFAVGSMWFRAVFTSKNPLTAAGVNVRADYGKPYLINQAVTGTTQNEMAEFTTLFTSEDLFSPTHQNTLVSSLSNGNKVFHNCVFSSRTLSQGYNPKFSRLITNVNQVNNAYDTTTNLTPREAVLSRSQLTTTYDAKTKNYTHTVSIRWPYYAQGSVFWPFLTGSRFVVTFTDLLMRPVAVSVINKPSFQVYSATQTLLNPLRVNRPEANIAAQYRRWFPRYSELLLNGKIAPLPSTKLSFAVNALAASVTSPVFSGDWSQVKEINVAVRNTTRFSFEADTNFFTRSFFKKFVNRPEQYGYFIDQAVIAVSVPKGGKPLFYTNRANEPYLAALDPAGSVASANFSDFVGRFINKATLSSLVRQVVGAAANKPLTATVYLVTGLHPVIVNKKVLYYEVKYDANYRMIPGIVFSLKGAW